MGELFKKLKYKRAVKESQNEYSGLVKREGELVHEWSFYDTNRKVQDNAVKADSMMAYIKSIRNSMQRNTDKQRQLKEKFDGVPLGTYRKPKKKKGWQNW